MPVRTLRATRAEAVDLFVQFEPGVQPRLYCRAGCRPEESQFTELVASNVENLYIRSGDFGSFSTDLFDSIDRLLKEPLVQSTDKFAALQLAVAMTIEQTLRLADCSRFGKLANAVGSNLVALFGNGDVLTSELFRLARHDFAAFTHVTNVASYCVILARELGVTDHDQLRKIATGAILHDFGKRFIPARILTKTDELSSDERATVESHPLRGYTELCRNCDLDFGQLMMVYQHHEHVDGTGYPVRVLQNEIHPWARMLSIVDVFDTMTARRPLQEPATPESVLEYQRQQAGTRFDGDYVECWISTMTKA
ncbi:MAG TPA: HD domain-containing phosphohydrolase [Lacipirellulaceae bacterium]|nr:HD domain-containing phosphohydrolase [Lacipirellulaceae bacterium]